MYPSLITPYPLKCKSQTTVTQPEVSNKVIAESLSLSLQEDHLAGQGLLALSETNSDEDGQFLTDLSSTFQVAASRLALKIRTSSGPEDGL